MAAMPLLLRLLSGELSPPAEVVCEGQRLAIGKASSCDIQLPDPSVSNRHASLRLRGSQYVLVDEGSDNGTFVDGARLASFAPATLAVGQIVRIGRLWLQVDESLAAPPEQQPSLLGRRLVEAALRQQKQGTRPRLRAAGWHSDFELKKDDTDYWLHSQDLLEPPKGSLPLPTAGAFRLVLRASRGQLRVTLHGTAGCADIAGHLLPPGKARAWPPGRPLRAGELELTYEDPVLGTLRSIEQQSVEQLDPKQPLTPPPDVELAEVERDEDEDEDEPEADGALDSPPAPRARPSTGAETWTLADGLVFALAMGVIGASLWVLDWITRLQGL